MSWFRSMDGSKVNPHRHHIGNDLWPLDYSSSWHCRCMNLYIFWMHTLVWLIWAQFHQNRMILKIWPLYKRSLTFILFSPLSWQRNIVWISCNWLFYSLWLEEEFEIYFNLIGVFLSFIPIHLWPWISWSIWCLKKCQACLSESSDLPLHFDIWISKY